MKAASDKGDLKKTRSKSSKEDLAIDIARKYTRGTRNGIGGKGGETPTKEGVTTRSKVKQSLPRGMDASGKENGRGRSTSLDGGKRGIRTDDSPESEGGSVLRSRSRSDRNTDRESEEEDLEARASESEYEEVEEDMEEDVIIVEDKGSQRIKGEEMEQIRKTMIEAEKEVGQLVDPKDDCPSLSSRTRKEGGQGRPAETGGYYLRQLQKAHKELVEKAREIKTVRDALTPANLTHNRKVEEKIAIQELRYAPAENIPAAMLEAINGIDLVLEKSRKLCGDHRGKLNKSAGVIKAALKVMVERYEHPVTGTERDAEMELLRTKIAAQEEDLVALHRTKAENLRMQRELKELQETVAILKARQAERDAEIRVPRATGIGGKKRKLPPRIPSSSWDEEVDQEMGEEEGAGQGEGMDLEPARGTEGKIESSRNKVMEVIRRQGMPEAKRPPIQGRSLVLDPAKPPSESLVEPGPYTEQGYKPGMEQKLATLLVNCVNEKMEKMEERLRKDLAPLIQTKQGEKERDRRTLSSTTAGEGKSTAKTKGKIGGKEKGRSKRLATESRKEPSVPTPTEGKAP